jgi:integrase
VVALCDVPTGKPGRPSKSLSLADAGKVLDAAASFRLNAYIVLSILIGARPEELRALRWREVDLAGRADVTPPVPPSISVLRSVRKHGDTKTKKSRRRLAMPLRCVDALRTVLEDGATAMDRIFGAQAGELSTWRLQPHSTGASARRRDAGASVRSFAAGHLTGRPATAGQGLQPERASALAAANHARSQIRV